MFADFVLHMDGSCPIVRCNAIASAITRLTVLVCVCVLEVPISTFVPLTPGTATPPPTCTQCESLKGAISIAFIHVLALSLIASNCNICNCLAQ